MDEGYTQSDMEEFDRTANDKRNDVASSTERASYMDQYKVVQPYQKNNDTGKTEENMKTNTLYSGKGKHDQTILRTQY